MSDFVKNYKKGFIASIPMMVGGMPFGLLFGSLVSANDLPIWVAIAMSSLVYAGSAQFVAIGMIALGAPVWVIILTTFFVNLRHLLYSADLVKFVKHLPIRLRLFLGFGLIDETYAAVRPMYQDKAFVLKGHQVYIGSFLSFYIMWNITTIVGVLAGELIPGMSEWGLEFAMVATFIGIISPYLKNVPYTLAFVGAGFSSIVLIDLPNQLGLVVAALVGVTLGSVSELLLKRPKNQNNKNDVADEMIELEKE
ncbi:AzlC family ABC transporter permease [Marinomonas mediterranea]|uniref:AzlC family protein n=1 Tax=Marinomonas mediterranea (strain ATCC 700492 / JCM 21426 / NBRC 103028 / MMB-1) TaxID=717774 RepID=F2JTI7_MARM1|nr:AzlC family ABC transporter permease [Marinomonas mediterranea]ADZ91501.1 AzlC family protein [Marinomonas mediterranea MMB-1]